MKTYCKKIDPSDVSTIEGFVWETLQPKLKRRDYSEFAAGYCSLGAKQIRKKAQEGFGLYPEMQKAVRQISEDISERIRSRDLRLEPIRYEERTDGLSKKTRRIGIESVMQQIMEHVAVGCMEELWRAKYEFHQYASIQGKGQLRGARQIRKWTKQGKTRNFVKLDVYHCFQSLNRRTAMRWLRRDIRKNRILLWFVDALLRMHGEGLVIGSLLSQFLCNYFMSYAYRYVMGLCKVRRGKRVKLCSCGILYMDDIMLASSDRRNLLMAVRKLIRFLREAFGLRLKDGWNIRRHEDCPIDMMGYTVTAAGRIHVRGRIFLRARRAFVRAAKGDDRMKIMWRVSSYYGFFKAAGIRALQTQEGLRVSVLRVKARASAAVSADAKAALAAARALPAAA